MAKTTSFNLGPELDAFIRERVASGRYGNASEVMRAAVRLLERQETREAAWNAAIRAGLESEATGELQELDDVMNELVPARGRAG